MTFGVIEKIKLRCDTERMNRNISIRASKKELLIQQKLDKRITEIKNEITIAKKDANTKKDKSYILSELTHWQIKSLVIKEPNWGKFKKIEGDNTQNLNKAKLAEDISNEKLCDFVVNAIEDEELLDNLEIELDDGKITTNQVIKLIKNHCKENDGLVMKELINVNGDTRKVVHYNLDKGIFKGMFKEYVSSD